MQSKHGRSTNGSDGYVYNKRQRPQNGLLPYSLLGEMHMTYGYIRVSSTDQNEDRQQIAMDRLAVPRKNIYLDKQSGKDFARQHYGRKPETAQIAKKLAVSRYYYVCQK